LAFFRAIADQPKIRSVALSDIVLSEKWKRESGRMDFLTEIVRGLFLGFVSAACGVFLFAILW
jgi:hypothetical protein